MSLNTQMRDDLLERLNGKEIPAAVEISKAIKDGVSTLGLPSYFFGDRDAETVVVNLNPGEDSKLCDEAWCERTKGFGASVADFIRDYLHRQRTYGDKYGVTKSGKADSFDVKQAAFLTPWENSGIGLEPDPNWDDESYRMEAKTKVINNKLQLELVPYASSKFDFYKRDIKYFRPFVDILLDEIFSKERTYVIFQSAKFEVIFKDYNEAKPGTFEFLDVVETDGALKEDGKLKGRCRVVKINHSGKCSKALIAHTFPNQALSKAYSLMQKYGEECYKHYIKSNNR